MTLDTGAGQEHRHMAVVAVASAVPVLQDFLDATATTICRCHEELHAMCQTCKSSFWMISIATLLPGWNTPSHSKASVSTFCFCLRVCQKLRSFAVRSLKVFSLSRESLASINRQPRYPCRSLIAVLASRMFASTSTITSILRLLLNWFCAQRLLLPMRPLSLYLPQ